MNIDILTTSTRVAVIRHECMGDTLMATPVVAWLHRKYPHLEIEVQTKYPDIFKNFPGVVRAGMFSIATETPSIECGFYEKNLHMHPTRHYFEQAWADVDAEKHMRLYSTAEDENIAKELLKNVSRPFVTMHLKPSWTGMDSDVEQRTADYLQQHFPVVMVGQGHCPVHGPNVVNLYGKTTLHQLYEVIRASSFYVGGGCGVSHVAGCTDVPMLWIISWERPYDRAPLRQQVFFVDGEPRCHEHRWCAERNANVIHGHMFTGVHCRHNGKCNVPFSEVKDMLDKLLQHGPGIRRTR